FEEEAGIDGEDRQARLDLAHCDIENHEPFRAEGRRDRHARAEIIGRPLQNVAGSFSFKLLRETFDLVGGVVQPSITLISTGSTLILRPSSHLMAFLISSRSP